MGISDMSNKANYFSTVPTDCHHIGNPKHNGFCILIEVKFVTKIAGSISVWIEHSDRISLFGTILKGRKLFHGQSYSSLASRKAFSTKDTLQCPSAVAVSNSVG